MNDTTPIALQLYSVRDTAKADLQGVLQQVAAMGYDGVEFAGFHGHDAAQVKAWLDDYDLACPSTHTGIAQLEDDAFDATVAYHQTIGCDTILVPWLPPERRNTLAGCTETAAFFLELLDQLKALGLRTGFHIHAEDALPLEPPVGDGRSPWEIFADATPADFILQYDTANGMHGGTDPVATIRKHPGRSQLLHLKAFGDGTGTLTGHDGQSKAVLGSDDVDLAGVLQAAQEVGGTQWYIIEQEGHPTLSEMDAAEQSLAGLKRALGRD
ncbi:MAG: sugar phosphate isomerase/epimerase [Planctomycetota bacterium]